MEYRAQLPGGFACGLFVVCQLCASIGWGQEGSPERWPDLQGREVSEEELIEVFGSEHATDRAVALTELGRKIEALAGEEDERSALIARVMPLLGRGMLDPNPEVAAAALWVAGNLGAEGAPVLPLILKMALDPDPATVVAWEASLKEGESKGYPAQPDRVFMLRGAALGCLLTIKGLTDATFDAFAGAPAAVRIQASSPLLMYLGALITSSEGQAPAWFDATKDLPTEERIGRAVGMLEEAYASAEASAEVRLLIVSGLGSLPAYDSTRADPMLSEAIRERIEALIARAQNDPDPQVAMTAKVMMTGREGRP